MIMGLRGNVMMMFVFSFSVDVVFVVWINGRRGSYVVFSER